MEGAVGMVPERESKIYQLMCHGTIIHYLWLALDVLEDPGFGGPSGPLVMRLTSLLASRKGHVWVVGKFQISAGISTCYVFFSWYTSQ